MLEQNKINLVSLTVGCPYGNRGATCTFMELVAMELKDRVAFIREMSENDVFLLHGNHLRCLQHINNSIQLNRKKYNPCLI